MRRLSFNALARSAIAAFFLLAADAVRSQAKETAGATAQPAGASSAATLRADAPGTPSFVPWGNTQVVVYKSRRTLAVYRGGTFEKEYPVVLGLVPEGRKRHANDARTPEGLYHVVARQPHRRWQWFLEIDYPNAADRRAYESAVRAGRIPDENGAPFAIGSEVGIHGNDRAEEQEKGVDWTKGCIAMRSADIAELASRVPVGTPVWIVE